MRATVGCVKVAADKRLLTVFAWLASLSYCRPGLAVLFSGVSLLSHCNVKVVQQARGPHWPVMGVTVAIGSDPKAARWDCKTSADISSASFVLPCTYHWADSRAHLSLVPFLCHTRLAPGPLLNRRKDSSSPNGRHQAARCQYTRHSMANITCFDDAVRFAARCIECPVCKGVVAPPTQSACTLQPACMSGGVGR